jgi:hypothetical protein
MGKNKLRETSLEDLAETPLSQFCKEIGCPVLKYDMIYSKSKSKHIPPRNRCESGCLYSGEQFGQWMDTRGYKMKGHEVRKMISLATTASEYYRRLVEMEILPTEKR